MKKIKCIKCGIRFKDRQDEEDMIVDKELCWNCRHIWKILRMVISSFNYNPMMPKQLHREVVLKLEDVHIRKIK